MTSGAEARCPLLSRSRPSAACSSADPSAVAPTPASCSSSGSLTSPPPPSSSSSSGRPSPSSSGPSSSGPSPPSPSSSGPSSPSPSGSSGSAWASSSSSSSASSSGWPSSSSRSASSSGWSSSSSSSKPPSSSSQPVSASRSRARSGASRTMSGSRVSLPSVVSAPTLLSFGACELATRAAATSAAPAATAFTPRWRLRWVSGPWWSSAPSAVSIADARTRFFSTRTCPSPFGTAQEREPLFLRLEPDRLPLLRPFDEERDFALVRLRPLFDVDRPRELDPEDLDLAAPSPVHFLVHHHVGLEAGQIGAYRSLHVPHPASRLLDQAARLQVEGDLDAGEAVGELVEGHDAGVRDALVHLPLDSLVGPLLDDLGLELPGEAPDLGLEGDVGLVLLRDALQAVHELRPLLELGPLVVDVLDRSTDVGRLLDGHAPSLAGTLGLVFLATVSAAHTGNRILAGKRVLRDLLRNSGRAAGLVGGLVDAFLQALAHGVLGASGELARALRRERHQHRKAGSGRHALCS